MLIIEWEENYSIDRLSPSLLVPENDGKVVVHQSMWHGLKRWTDVEALLTFTDNAVVLDYEFDSKANKSIGVDRGRMRLRFNKEGSVTSVEWADPSGSYEARPKVRIIDAATYSALEGDANIVWHVRRERDENLRWLKLQSEPEPIMCHACHRDQHEYGVRATWEVHHLSLVSDGQKRNKLSDLAVLCPCCHRAIHSGGNLISVGDLARLLLLTE